MSGPGHRASQCSGTRRPSRGLARARRGARRARGSASTSLVEPGAPVVPAAESRKGARLDALHVVRRGIDDVDVRPDDVAALVVLDLLQLAELVGCLVLVRRALRLADEL